MNNIFELSYFSSQILNFKYRVCIWLNIFKYWPIRPLHGHTGGHYFHTWCTHVQKFIIRYNTTNTRQRYMGALRVINSQDSFFILFLQIFNYQTFLIHFWSIFLIHSANPKSRPVAIVVFAHVVRPYPLFKSSKRKQSSLLAWLWVWPSGSLMTLVL